MAGSGTIHSTDDFESRRSTRRATLMIPRRFFNGRCESILLARKARGFGTGKLVGFGGKQKQDETIEQANKREVLEETGIRVDDATKVGLLLYTFDCEPDLFLEVHVFSSSVCFETTTLNDEYDGPAEWYQVDSIPFENMWADFALWCPLLLKGERFCARIKYSDFDTVRSSVINRVALEDKLEPEQKWQ